MATEQKKPLNPVWASMKPFVNGGASGCVATCIIQPIDMVKVRLQLGDKGNPLTIATNLARTQGVGALYKGLSAGLLRQCTYTTARLGIYNNITEAALKMNDHKPLPLWQKAVLGLTAGGLGALVGSPADLALIRMQADTTLPLDQRRNYKGVGDALARIVREEGAGGLFTGAGPTVVRAMALNMGMLASNDQAKEVLVSLGMEKGSTGVVLGAAGIAGFFASACSLPFDYVKTQMQKMKPDATGKLPYTSSIDCAVKTFKEGGPLKFYTGFPTFFIRIGERGLLAVPCSAHECCPRAHTPPALPASPAAPHVMITLVVLAKLPQWEAKIGL